MTLFFFITSETIDLTHYTIKDIPGSSGRLDVIARCILAAILGETDFESNIQIWVFLNEYGTWIIDPKLLDYSKFPKNELLLTDSLVELLNAHKDKTEVNENNPLKISKHVDLKMLDIIEDFKEKGIKTIILSESGEDFFENLPILHAEESLVFIIGNQSGDFLDSKQLSQMNLPLMSIGSQSYLASSVIRLIKLHLLSRV